MSLRVVQTPESLADIALQAEYFATVSDMALARRFIDSIKVTVRLLADHPGIGRATNYPGNVNGRSTKDPKSTKAEDSAGEGRSHQIGA